MNTEQKWWRKDISGELWSILSISGGLLVLAGTGMLIGWFLAFAIPRLVIVFG